MDDTRWKQRFDSFNKALARLTEGLDKLEDCLKGKEDKASVDLFKDGVIQRFEFTHELAWKVLKDYAEYQGYTDIRGSRDAIRRGYEMGLISNSEWMSSIGDRNLTSHDYDEATATEIYNRISEKYHPMFLELKEYLEPMA